MSWGKLGKDIATKLETIDDPDAIRALGHETIESILKSPNPDNALRQVNREILKVFPRSHREKPLYFYDSGGRANLPKWRHLIFQSLTLKTSVASVSPESEDSTPSPIEPTQGLTMEDLNLDAVTQEFALAAMEQLGMSVAEFALQAVRVYAKTVVGKGRLRDEDLSAVATDKLLKDFSYSTHPGRARELVKRAIRAIKYHNSHLATENADRWCITQSAIARLTGSKPKTIGAILELYQSEVDDHNQHYGLDNYTNRKRGRKIQDELDLNQLVPDGLD